MNPLLDALVAQGAIDRSAGEWVSEHLAARGGSASSALLELDLIDEDTLLRALSKASGLPAATHAMIRSADPGLGTLLPAEVVQERDMCPLRVRDGVLRVLVEEKLKSAEREACRLLKPRIL